MHVRFCYNFVFSKSTGREDWMVKEGTLVEVLQGAKQEIPEILSGGYGGGGGGNSWGQNERSEEDTVNKENEDAQDSRDKWYFFTNFVHFHFVATS